MTIKNCENCNKEFKVYPKNKFIRRFCSFDCRKSIYNSTMREKMSLIKKEQFKNGIKPWNKDLTNIYSEETRESMGSNRGLFGESSHNWRGGITPEINRIRNSQKHSDWSIAIKRRDDFTCGDCGIRGGKLVAHHIKSFKEYPDFRFDLNNGITLCRKCHKKTHKIDSLVLALN